MRLDTAYQRILEDLNNVVVCQRGFPLSSISEDEELVISIRTEIDLNQSTVEDLVKIWSAQVGPPSSELLLEGMAGLCLLRNERL